MAILRGNIGQSFPVVFRYFRFGIVYLAFIYYVRAWITAPSLIYPQVCCRSEVILTPDYASSVLGLGAHDCSLGLIYPVNMRLNLAVAVPLDCPSPSRLHLETTHYKATLVPNPDSALIGVWIVPTGVVMKRMLNVVIAVIMLTSLSACMVVPLYDRPYYGGGYSHHEGWGHRRW